MRASSDAYPDPRAKETRSVVVDVTPIRRLHKPVSLSDMKHDPKFADFVLIRESRLSVLPVPGTIWSEILKLSG
jgi:predicted RNA-binding protein with PUA-like domain